MNTYRLAILLLAGGLASFGAFADDGTSSVPEPFRGFDENSKLVIDYTDLNSLLDMVVLDTGRSTRKKADDIKAKTGTRMKAKINRETANEGNRFYYEIFKDNEQNLQTLANIRARLVSIPLQVPLEKFSRDEQLAYWLNLYNITILGEIASKYPSVDLEKMLTGRRSLLDKDLLDIAGVTLSLNDIQYTILKQNYDANPLIIYGLYQGNIGGPNIRKRAYTGKHVYADLIENALEFVNSNRGTMSKSEQVFRVSSLYDRNRVFFANFDADLRAHVLDYLEGQQRAQLTAATSIEPVISDWMVTDLFGSYRDPAGSIANNSAALMGASRTGSSAKFQSGAPALSRYSPAVMERLKELEEKRQKPRSGTVTVEELGQAEGQETEAKVD